MTEMYDAIPVSHFPDPSRSVMFPFAAPQNRLLSGIVRIRFYFPYPSQTVPSGQIPAHVMYGPHKGRIYELGQPSNEMKELETECREIGTSCRELSARSEKMLLTYRKRGWKQIDLERNDPAEQRARLMMYMSAVRDMRISAETKEFREAVSFLSAAGYLDRILDRALQDMSLKYDKGDMYYQILVEKYDGSGGLKDFIIANHLGVGHTTMCARKKEAILAIGLELIMVTLPDAIREVACWRMYEEA